MSYTQLYSSGDQLDGSVHSYVYLYPNTSSNKSEAKDDIAPDIDQAYGDIESWGAIHYYEVNINYDYPDIDSSDQSTFIDGFSDWLQNQGYYDGTGVHVGITSGFDDAGTEGIDETSEDSAFKRSWATFVGTDGSKGKYTNFGVQEPLHMFILWPISDVQDLINSGSHMHEHDLGLIRSDGAVTPLATLYESTHADHGRLDCQTSYNWNGTYNSTVTDCTKDAVGYTAEHEFSGFTFP